MKKKRALKVEIKKSIGLKPEVFFKPQIWKNRPKGRGILRNQRFLGHPNFTIWSKPNLSNKFFKKNFLRYLILLGLMFSLPLIYKIFTPLTIYPTLALLKLFYEVTLINNLMIIDSITFIEIIPACIAGSAYLLLLILNMSVPMNYKKRAYSIFLSFAFLLVLNILRIFILSVWYHEKILFFDFTHKFFWYFLSTIFVIVIWFLIVKIFLIKEIPVYSDMREILRSIH